MWRFHARSEERARPTVDAIEAAGGRAFAATADLRDRAAIAPMCAAAIERLGGLDILVNNAGTFVRKQVAEMDLASWDAMVEINLTAPYLVTQATLPAIKASRRGASIIFISSIGAGASSSGLERLRDDQERAHRLHALASRTSSAATASASTPSAPAWVETRMARDTHRSIAADLGVDYETFYAENMRANMLGALLTPGQRCRHRRLPREANAAATSRRREHTVCGGLQPRQQRKSRPRRPRRLNRHGTGDSGTEGAGW